jgi:hypothetical protein
MSAVPLDSDDDDDADYVDDDDGGDLSGPILSSLLLP